jgi:hypothetical protein
MKRLFYIFLGLVFVASANAATRATDCQQAVEAFTNGVSDVFVFLHGSDWCPAGERLKTRIWDSDKFAAAFGDSVCLVAVDQPDQLPGKISGALRKVLDKVSASAPGAIAGISTVNKSVYKALDDGSWLVESSPNPYTDNYTIRLRQKASDVRVLILTLMTDDSLPGRGPGRDNGNVVITEFKAFAEDESGKEVSLKFSTAWSDHNQRGHGCGAAIDGRIDNSNGWAIDGNRWHTNSRLVLLIEKPVPANCRITVKMFCNSKWRRHTPGRFKIQVSGDTVLAEKLDIYKKFTQQQNRNKALNCSSDNYPAIICFDSKRRSYGRIQPIHQDVLSSNLVAKLTALQKKRIERDRCWEKADALTGHKKALYLGEGLELMGGPGGRKGAYLAEFNELKKADPDDQLGYIRKWEFPFGSIRKKADSIRKAEGEAAALAYLDKEIDTPENAKVSHATIQDLMLLKFNIYRGWKGHENERYDVLRKIAEIDPHTHQGIGAQGYLMYRGESKDFSLYHNWFPRHVENGNGVWRIHYGVPKAFQHPGIYRVSLMTRSGKNAIKIKSVALVVGGKVVSTDTHEAILRHKSNSNNNYYLEWPYSAGAKADLLKVEYEVVDGTDNRGSISVSSVLPEDIPGGLERLHKTSAE